MAVRIVSVVNGLETVMEVNDGTTIRQVLDGQGVTDAAVVANNRPVENYNQPVQPNDRIVINPAAKTQGAKKGKKGPKGCGK